MRIDGAIYSIRFVPRDKPYSDGIYAVSDAKLIRAIRKHPYFGSVITEMEEETAAPVEEKKEFAASYPDVTKSQDAKEILVSRYGVDADVLTNKAAIRKSAEELNISFPNLQ